MISLTLVQNKKFKLLNTKLKKLKDNQCRIDILCSGICSSDIPRAFDSMAYHYPLVLGHEFVGVIKKIGRKVTRFSEGDLVSAFPLVPCSTCEYCDEDKFNLCNNYNYHGSRIDGSFAESLNVNEWNLFKISKNLPIEKACLIEPTAVVFNIISKIKYNLHYKKKILILGAGFLGQTLSRILKITTNNFQIDILDRNKFKLNISEKYTDEQYLFSKDKDNLYIKKLLDSKYDFVIETTGNNECFKDAVLYAKKDSVVIYSGNINKNLVFNKKEVSNILRKQLILKGVWNSSFKSKNNDWNKAHSFLLKTRNFEDLVTHETELPNAMNLLNLVNKIKKGKKINNYIKGIIKTK
jgi:L-iditol 2-dehydrogenase